MRALYRAEDGTVCFRSIPEPNIAYPDDVKIRIRCNTIGIDDQRMERVGDFYSREGILGNEMAGDIVEVGEQAQREGFSVGDRVSGTPAQFCGRCYFCKKQKYNCCNDLKLSVGTLCEYVVWKSRQLIKLSPQTCYRDGCLIESIAGILEGISMVNIAMGDTILILGGNYDGLVASQLAKKRGAGRVVVADPQAYRRELARTFGADATADYYDSQFQLEMLRSTDFNGFDIVIESSGEMDALPLAFSLAARGGKLLFYKSSMYHEKITLHSGSLQRSNLSIFLSSLSNKKMELAQQLLPLLHTDRLITAELPFYRAIEAFELQKNMPHIKVAISI